MFNKIRDFIIVKKPRPDEDSPEPMMVDMPNQVLVQGDPQIMVDALAHYCALCKRGFHTKGARNAHKTLKHGRDNGQ